ncbi:MAG: DUF6377 domain-containing protein, partial [Bacteroidales bacterium]|nr:DUF6377 domain-containing protein [Bacteroidales bacterium]
MRILQFSTFLILSLFKLSAFTTASLDSLLVYESKLIEDKENRINDLKSSISQDDNTLLISYQLYSTLLDEYESYRYDSAFKYVNLLVDISTTIDNKEYINLSKIRKADVLKSSGLYKEAIDLLETISVDDLSEKSKINYYEVKVVIYFGLADLYDSHYSPLYEKDANDFTDSLLKYAPLSSYTSLYYSGLKAMRKDDDAAAHYFFEQLLQKDSLLDHQKAIVYSTMSSLYHGDENGVRRCELLIEAAIFDIQSVTKETTALITLAQELHQLGEIDKAYTYIKIALADAIFYGARHRKVQVGEILPIIEQEMLSVMKREKKLYFWYSIVLSALFLIVLFSIIIVRKQMIKVKRADRKIGLANDKLRDANRIKDEYIGHYFSAIYKYVEMLENFQSEIKRDVNQGNIERLKLVVNKLNASKYRNALFVDFDTVFLKLFPTFVSDFNHLFKEEDHILSPTKGTLTNELRIFALLRLGVTEINKMSKILGLSVNTIYAYKSKFKQK